MAGVVTHTVNYGVHSLRSRHPFRHDLETPPSASPANAHPRPVIGWRYPDAIPEFHAGGVTFEEIQSNAIQFYV